MIFLMPSGTRVWTDEDDGEVWYQRAGFPAQLLQDADSLCGAGIFRTGVDDPFREACGVHDSMYKKRAQFEEWGFDREWIDKNFLTLMLRKADGNLALEARAYLYYNTVRAVGWVLYYRHPGKADAKGRFQKISGNNRLKALMTTPSIIETPEDPVQRRYGWIKDVTDVNDRYYLAPRYMLELPTRVDMRERAGAVFDQGVLGSCLSHALAGLLMHVDRMDGNDPIELPSRLFMYYNQRVIDGTVMSDSGASFRDGIKSLNETGSCQELLWGYDRDFREKPKDECYTEAKKHIITQYRRIDSLYNLKACLAEGNPVAFGFAVYESFQSQAVAKTGFVPMPRVGEQMLGGHAVFAVGYDDALGCLIVKNSWGAAWADQGYCYMPYGFVTDRLADDFWSITTQL